jgi:sugar transferase (PEP-CTERM system associated)
MIQLFRVFIPSSILGLILSETLLTFGCFIAAIGLDRGEDWQFYLLYEDGLLRVTAVTASILIGLYFTDLYENTRVRNRTLLLQQICLVLGIAFLLQGFLAYVNADWRLPRWTMVTGSALCLVVLPIWRILYGRLLFHLIGAERVLFIGRSPVIRQIVEQIRDRPELGFVPLGYLDTDEGDPVDDFPCRPMGPVRKVKQVVAAAKPDRIVVGMSERRHQLPVYDLLDLSLSGVRVEESSTLYEIAFTRMCINELRPSQLIFSHFGPGNRNLLLRSGLNFIAAFAGVVITWPVMLLVALAVKLTSRGPVLFCQTRVGLNDRRFTLFKFRSMYVDAEVHTGAVWATEDDPRITPLGRWLRRLRLDELPQLFNVLRGEMALVGPRPERPEFVQTLQEQIPFYRQRHSVLPGITGWAQINYKYGNTLDDTVMKLEYDLYYIKHASLALDFYIMFHTVKTMVLQRGAQ